MSLERIAVHAVSSDLFDIGEQFHEPNFIRIAHGRLTIWLHPFGMLDSEVVMDLLSKLSVSMNLMSHRHWSGETQVRRRTVFPMPRRYRRPDMAP